MPAVKSSGWPRSTLHGSAPHKGDIGADGPTRTGPGARHPGSGREQVGRAAKIARSWPPTSTSSTIRAAARVGRFSYAIRQVVAEAKKVEATGRTGAAT